MHTIQTYFHSIFLAFEKRVRLIVVTAVLSTIIFLLTLLPFAYAWFTVPLIAMLSYLGVYIALLRGIEKGEWFMLFLIPLLYCVMFYLAYYLVPGRLLTRVPFFFLLSIGFYSAVLSSNIFNVAVVKSLQLMRAAFSINYLLHVIVLFLTTLVAFTLLAYTSLAIGVVALTSYVLAMQYLWSIKPQPHIEKHIFTQSLFISYVTTIIALVASFLPVPTTVYALFVAGSYYSLVGLMYLNVDERLYWDALREYVYVWVLIALLTFFSFVQ